MELEIPESLFDSIQVILKYQNTLLLKEISKDKGWKLAELKKEYLKTEDVKLLVKKYNKKKKKEIIKKSKTKDGDSEPPSNDVEPPSNDVEPPSNDVEPTPIVNETTQVLENEETNGAIELNDEDNSGGDEEEGKNNVVIEESNELEPLKIPEPEKKVKKKRIKKIVKNQEIRCHKYTIEENIFYVNVENNNTYDKNLEFVGRMVGNTINFNEDEI